MAPDRMFEVLIVDDEPGLADLYGIMVQSTEVKVYPYTDPLKAAEDFEADRIQVDAAIVDRQMPFLNGMELVARLRVRKPDLPAALISAYTDDLHEQSIEILTKPVGFEDLESLTRRLRGPQVVTRVPIPFPQCSQTA